MTNVLVCVKRVPDSSSEVVLTEDAQAVDGRFAGFTMSPHEECAVELAVQVTAATGGEAAVLTLGDADAVEQLRSALAVGASAATLVQADAARFGPADVAREIAAVVRAHEAEGSTHDLVLLGNDAADSGDFQVGIRLAYELGRPVVNGARVVSVDAGPDGQSMVTARVDGPDGSETYQVPLPAVVTIREGGVEPRYPSVPGRMKAKKVPVEERTPSTEPSGPKRVKLTLPPPVPSNVQILGEGAAAAPAVVDLLEQLGVLALKGTTQ
jgi:electron transfer flavoprotein beta subunit